MTEKLDKASKQDSSIEPPEEMQQGPHLDLQLGDLFQTSDLQNCEWQTVSGHQVCGSLLLHIAAVEYKQSC